MSAPGADLSTASPRDAWIKLRDAALAGAPFDQLSALALTLAKIEDAHRVHWDEQYQDERRKLEDAVRANGNDVNALLDLGVFLYREVDIPGEQLGPAAPIARFERVARYNGNATSLMPCPSSIASWRSIVRTPSP